MLVSFLDRSAWETKRWKILLERLWVLIPTIYTRHELSCRGRTGINRRENRSESSEKAGEIIYWVEIDLIDSPFNIAGKNKGGLVFTSGNQRKKVLGHRKRRGIQVRAREMRNLLEWVGRNARGMPFTGIDRLVGLSSFLCARRHSQESSG